MKKILTLLAGLALLAVSANAQEPNNFNFGNHRHNRHSSEPDASVCSGPEGRMRMSR